MNKDKIRIIHVDDDTDFLNLAAEFLERQDDRFTVQKATSATDGLDKISDQPPDCIVSDYNMPEKNGIEFLQSVRDKWPDLPFILFTGKGSEEVASEAISKGATGYLQKTAGTDQYELLANRIGNAVEKYLSDRQATNLERIRQLVSDINKALVRSTSPEEIETRVCQLISESDPYVTACIASVNRDTMEIEPRNWAGEAAGYFEELEMTVDEVSPGRHAPEGRAFHDREVAVSQNIQEDDRYAKWREATLQRDFRSLAVIPIEYKDKLHGLLATFASQPNAFDETERELLADLGDDIAHTLHSQSLETELKRQNNLFTEAQEIASVGAWEYDIQEDRTTWTDQVYKIHGRPQGYVPENEDVIELYHPDDQATLREAFRGAVEEGQPYDLELRCQTGDGKTRWVRTCGNPRTKNGELVRVRGAIQDITERKQRERKLARTKNLMSKMEELADVGAWEYDSETERLTLTDGAYRLYGHNPDTDLNLEEAFGAIHPNDRELLRDRFDACLETGEPYEIEIRLITPDGGQRWITARGERTNKQESGTVVRGYIQDITERKERRTELEEYETVIEALTDAVYVLDEEGRFTYVNEKFVELVGYDRETILGKTPSLIKDEKAVERAEDSLGRLLSSDGPDTVTFEVTVQPREGEPIVCEDYLGVLPYDGEEFDGSVGALRDITDRKKRKQKLELVETLFANTQECQFIVDVADGEFELCHANDYYKRTVGLSPGEPVTGQTPTDLFGEDGGQEILNRYTTCVETRDSVKYTVEVPVPEEGTVYRTILTPVVTDDEVTHIVGTARDVTEHKRREKELERQNDRLGKFASVVSHDLQSPLRIAEGKLELAQTERDFSYVDDATDAIDRSQALIEDLLVLARGGDIVGSLEPVSLSALAEDFWGMVSSDGATLTVDTDRKVSADRGILRQLLENLFTNAIEHGGTDVEVTVGGLADGFYIEDDGIGVPDGKREDIFEAGYSTAEDGTGLGLRIVKEIVNAHGWEVRVTDGDDGGGRFEITGLDFRG